jgi:hypothetical protein
MKRGSGFLTAAVLLLVLCSGGPTAQADLISPSHSTFALTAESQLGNSATVTHSDSQSQGSTLHSMSVGVSADSINIPNHSLLLVTGNGSATWNSASNGEVTFSNVGWTSINAHGSADLSPNVGWVYTFVSNVTGSFNINYTVAAKGLSATNISNPLVGLNGFFLYEGAGSTAPTKPTDQISVPSMGTTFSTTGTTSLALTAGKTYTVEIQNFANLFQNIGTTDSHMNGTFDFSVVAAPEPSSLSVTIAICCLGGIAALAKRRWNTAK